MTPNRWREIEDCYHEAMKLTDATEQTAYLAQLDPGIRAEVEELLAQESQDSPLDHRSNLFEALTPGAMLGHYRIEQSIGAGGMGEVYRATDTKLRRSDAIKVCGAGFIRRFEREARAIAALNHPNICTLYESGPDYLVMELVEGPTLADQIRKGAIPINEAIDIARQIAEALEAAHEHGIIHRDLKPANIKLTADGRVKVLDFGLAKSTAPTTSDAAAATITNTEQGLIIGTPSYMSPEQAEGLPTDKRADIWSFGVVLWEMLTGHRLFDAQSASRILSEVLQREIDFEKLPAAIPDHIRTLLRRCLDRNLKTRLRDIGEARITLLHKTDAPRQQQTRSFSPATLGWTSAAFLATALGSTLVWHFAAGTSAPPPQRVRLQFPAPEPAIEDLNLSPDGRTLLIIGSAGTTAQKLWTRNLDSLETKLLANVEGLRSYAFWSPDSRYICYLSGSRLYRIERNGGTSPVLMAEVPGSTSSAMWHEDGVIVLGSREGMFRLTVPGGALTKLYEQPGFFPAALPKGRFTFMRPDGIYAGWLNGRAPVRISSDRATFHHAYVPAAKGPGHLFLFRDGTLLTQRFDPDKLEFEGTPIPLADLTGGPAMFACSDTGILVTSPDPTLHRLTWIDRSGQIIRHATPELRLRNPLFRLSPDESRALAVIRNPDGKYDLWVAALETETLSRFTFSEATAGIWSPDGRRILWSTPGGNHYVKPSDGSGSETLLVQAPAGSSILTDWSPDGAWIASTQVSDQGRAEIWMTEAAGDPHKTTPLLQAEFAAFDGRFSPDGRWLAFTGKFGAQPAQVFVESVPRGAGHWQVSAGGGDWPVWRRDGQELYFRQNSKLMAAPVRTMPSSVLEFGTPQPLFDLPPGSRFQASRNGQRFLVAMPVQQEGSQTRMITVDTDWRAGLLGKPL